MKYAILMGLNLIDPKYYGSNGKLEGCINDVKTWLDLIEPDVVETMINSDATPENFLGVLHDFNTRMVKGDTLFILYSGHGTQVRSSYKSEKDGLDEAFCFYNRVFLDKNFNDNLSRIRKGVQVVGIYDCCFSGGVSRNTKMAKNKSFQVEMQNRQVFPQKSLKCSYLALNASLESQPAMDGTKNGLFTETMKNTFKGQPILEWVKEASKLVKVQTINHKISGAKFDWSTFKI